MSQPQSASTRVACEAPAPFDVRTEPSNLSPSYPYIEFDHGRPPLRSDGEEGSSRQPKNEVSPERSYTVSDFKGRNDKERKEFQVRSCDYPDWHTMEFLEDHPLLTI